MIERKGVGVSVLRNLGDPHTQYGGVLTESGQLSDVQAQTLYAALREAGGIDTAFINLVPRDSALARVMPAGTEVAKLANESAYLDLSAFRTRDGYLESLGKTQKRNRKRRHKQLAAKGEIGFEVLRPEDPGFAARVEECLRFKDIWLRQTGKISKGLVMENHGSFLTSLRSSGEDGPYLFALTVAGEPVAIELGFLRQGHYYAYVGGFDWAWRDASPGKVQMEMTIGWLIQQGASAYDLLSNPTGYKESWTNRSVPLQSHIVNLTLRGEAYSTWWITHARPAVKRIYEWLPHDVRVGLSVVRQIEVWYVG
jgi:CelD/BcsL family acetyltransferase involved in cellulose biosynthesis